MRWKHWCAWSLFQSCNPGFKGHSLVLRLTWAVRYLEVFSYGADSLSALLKTYIRTLVFPLVRVAFCCVHNWAGFISAEEKWNATSQQSLDEALLRDMAGTILVKSKQSSYITPLMTSSPGTHHPVSWGTLQQQRLLAVLRNFPQKRLISCCCL